MRRFLTGTNYCGPGGYGPTLGEVDEACAQHDKAYTAPYMSDYVSSQRADGVFLRALSDAKPVGFRQYVTKYIAQRYFTLKTMANGYIEDASHGHVALPHNNYGVNRKRRFGEEKSIGAMVQYMPPAAMRPRYYRKPAAPFPYYRSKRKYGYKTKKAPFVKFNTSKYRYFNKIRKLRLGRRYRR